MLEVSQDDLIDVEILESYSAHEEENFENEARGYQESHIKICSKQASSFGLFAAEKEETPVVRGVYGFSEARFFIHKDTLGIPLRISYIYEDEIHWVEPEPEPEPSVHEAQTHSEEIEELVVEAAEQVHLKHQAEHVADSEEVEQRFEKQAMLFLFLSYIQKLHNNYWL